MSPGKCGSVWGRAWKIFLVIDGSPRTFLKTDRILLKYLNGFFSYQICWKITRQMSTFVFKKDINRQSQCNVLLDFIPHLRGTGRCSSWHLNPPLLFLTVRWYLISQKNQVLTATGWESRDNDWIISGANVCLHIYMFCAVNWWKKTLPVTLSKPFDYIELSTFSGYLVKLSLVFF